MNILDNAKKHFTTQFNQTLKKMTVPEWQTDIYYRQTNSFATESRIIELQQQGKTVEALVESLIVKARNEDGSKMFTMPDKMVLLNEVDPNVIIRVVGEINAANADEDTVEAAEKN